MGALTRHYTVRRIVWALAAGALAGHLTIASARAGPLQDGFSAYNSGQYDLALNLWEALAGDGDREAQFYVGFLFELGLGVTQNSPEAVKWMRRSAENGSADAQVFLANLYFSGRGTPQDFVQSYAWASVAAAQGRQTHSIGYSRHEDRVEAAAGIRDSAAGLLSPESLDRAQELAERYWDLFANQSQATDPTPPDGQPSPTQQLREFLDRLEAEG